MGTMKNSSIKFCLSLFLLFIFSLPARADSFPARDTIRIVGDKYFGPYTFLDGNGKPVGFFIDITKAVMRELNRHYVIKLQDWHPCLNDIESGKADLVVGIAYSQQRATYLKFGGSYINISQNIVVRKDSRSIQTFKDLTGERVVVENKAVAQDILDPAGYSNICVVNDLASG